MPTQPDESRPSAIVIAMIPPPNAPTVDRASRSELRHALVAYMRGEIRTFAFDDVNMRCIDANDPALVAVARTLWLFHDDLVNHPVSVPAEGWEVLRHVVAFLTTDLPAEPAGNPLPPYWPFRDSAEWAAHEHLSRNCGLPAYDPAIHDRPIHSWWYPIPTSVGIAVIVLFVGLLFAFAICTAAR